MSHSPEQMRQKEHAMEEALRYQRYAQADGMKKQESEPMELPAKEHGME